MTDIKDFILQLEDTTLSLEEQQAALLLIEQTLIENKQIQEKTLEESSNLIVDAVRTVEEKLDAKFTALKTDSKLKGPKGDQGIRGENGKPGRDGVDGRDGINGHDGADGIDGEDGRYVVNVEVDLDDTLLVTLSDGTQIKTTKEIKGPKGDQGPQGLRGSNGNGVVVGGSTGQVLTKVSNTDYDVTWSTNGAGTVTSVGGTGTVNGLSLSGTVTSTGNLTLGGTLDLSTPPAIGATTPSTVNATTITGQTGVLRGTGTNLLLQSNGFTVALGWAVVASTTTGSELDPFGGSTASLFTANGTSSTHNLQSTALTFTSGITYTTSVYFKAGTNNFVQLRMTSGIGSPYANFNISTGVAGTTTATSSTIVSVGGGWYRASMTYVASASASAALGIFIITSNTASSAETNTLATSIYLYGSQIEIGSTANTYIPTTTTAVYGTPTLSFSGVSTIGLESNGALFVQPAGTGALQAQATTSTTAGGNARGANAVDWQTSRYSASQVASAVTSVIAGGTSNVASGSSASVVGGYDNRATGTLSFIGGGTLNTSSGVYSSISAGNLNAATGYYGFVGNGFTNSTTSNSAVTTQSGTMNATTAVTLSGSNASIKVGQYITGTSIGGDTYVAAISGTALTLSKVASGSSTSTLSFFTPHGVVVGGGNNQATGSYSFIGGGGDAGTAANRNVASGDWSTVGGGFKNVASGLYSTVVGGYGNTSNNTAAFVGGGGFAFGSVLVNLSSGQSSGVVSGISNNASGNAAFIGAGYGNLSNSQYSAIMGGSFGTSRIISGNHVFSACVNPVAQSSGINQAALLILARQTTDATATALASDSSAAGTTNQVILPNNSAYFFTGEVISGVTGGGNTKGWTIEGVIKRGANAASTALVGTPTVTSMYADLGAATWAIAVTADTTNGGLRVTFTGQAATTIRTVAKISTVEMTY